MEKIKKIKQAVILAGGIGARLRPFTLESPKPMIPVNGKPFLCHLIEILKKNRIKQVVLLLGYKHEKITSFFGNGKKFGIDIKYSIGKVEDETGTRVYNARKLLDDHFLLMYSDNYWPLNLKEMAVFFNDKQVLASTTVFDNVHGTAEYGAKNNICVDKDGYVRFYDKTRKNKELNGVDIGFFLVSKKAIELAPKKNFSFEKDFLPVLIKKHQLAGYLTGTQYYYVTNMESVKNTEKFLKKWI